MMPDIQSVVHPAGIQAARVAHLWWTMFWICASVWAAVAIAALWAIRRGRRGTAAPVESTIAKTVAMAGGVRKEKKGMT